MSARSTSGVPLTRRSMLGGGAYPYEGASPTSRELGAWHPGLRSASAEINPSRDKLVARSRDLDRNNGWASGGADRRADGVVGANIRLEARPNWEAMDWEADFADDWATRTEAKFRSWANGNRKLCDVERDLKFGGMVRLAYQTYLQDGECLLVTYMLKRGGRYGTCFKIVDTDRLCNPHGQNDNDTLRAGVQLNPRTGEAIGYWIRNAHPSDSSTTGEQFKWTYVPRESRTGRPLAIHMFNKRRAEQKRGVSKLASVLKRFKMLDRYDDAELEAALLNAIQAAVITSPYQPEDVAAAIAPANEDVLGSAYNEARIAYREHNKITLNGVQVNHLFGGEEFKMVGAERPAPQYPAFQAAVLRSIAAAFGLSYEQLSQDWSGINYSSARTLLNEIWRGFTVDRFLFTQTVCSLMYEAWLEEAVFRGEVEIPGGPYNFYKWRDEICEALWLGPGRGTIDPKKEEEAADLAIAGGRSNLSIETAEQGRDYRDVLTQLAREQKLRKKLGLADPTPPGAGAQANGDDNPDDQDRRDERERAGEDA
ncbi:phage portal protein [Rhizorhabdus wittichii]|uniref:Phage portal protein n=1 Tax=Rhizorhabdus wittichii TaxID=160791 RepID=A0A975CYH7_9SPHN|nr:phage portal protein [Rhizorhabdus wittichii]QTH19652.1 phage portal protein [Rhizorhabdus wittichii]